MLDRPSGDLSAKEMDLLLEALNRWEGLRAKGTEVTAKDILPPSASSNLLYSLSRIMCVVDFPFSKNIEEKNLWLWTRENKEPNYGGIEVVFHKFPPGIAKSIKESNRIAMEHVIFNESLNEISEDISDIRNRNAYDPPPPSVHLMERYLTDELDDNQKKEIRINKLLSQGWYETFKYLDSQKKEGKNDLR